MNTKSRIKEILRFFLTPKFIYYLMRYYNYYNSISEIKKSINGYKLLFFPFLGNGKFKTKDKIINVPRRYWATLPTIARIIRYDAYPKWEDDVLYVTIQNITLASSPQDKTVAVSIKEIFIDNEYQINKIDFKEKSVIDIGANIGDSSIVFAKAGAKVVYAFEPLPMLHEFLKKNISLNGYEGLIIPYPVGLSNKNEVISIWAMGHGSAGTSSVLHEVSKRKYSPGYIKQSLRIVDAMSYFKENSIGKVDILKMDCEHCEYALLNDDNLLKYLNPEIILLEFHAGSEKLSEVLKSCGYQVTTNSKYEQVGLLFATKQP